MSKNDNIIAIHMANDQIHWWANLRMRSYCDHVCYIMSKYIDKITREAVILCSLKGQRVNEKFIRYWGIFVYSCTKLKRNYNAMWWFHEGWSSKIHKWNLVFHPSTINNTTFHPLSRTKCGQNFTCQSFFKGTASSISVHLRVKILHTTVSILYYKRHLMRNYLHFVDAERLP